MKGFSCSIEFSILLSRLYPAVYLPNKRRLLEDWGESECENQIEK